MRCSTGGAGSLPAPPSFLCALVTRAKRLIDMRGSVLLKMTENPVWHRPNLQGSAKADLFGYPTIKQRHAGQWCFSESEPSMPDTPSMRGPLDHSSDTTGQTQEVRALYAAFFDPITREIWSSGEEYRLTYGMLEEENDRGFTWRLPLIGFHLGFWGGVPGERDRAQVYLSMRTHYPLGLRIYEALVPHRSFMSDQLRQIDPAFDLNWWGTPMDWPQSPPVHGIGAQIAGTIYDPPQELERIRDWMLAFYYALKQVMEPRLEEAILFEETIPNLPDSLLF